MAAHAIPTPDKKQLRSFGLILAGMFAGLFGILIPALKGNAPWKQGSSLVSWAWIVAGVFLLFALLAPKLLGGFYRYWMKAGLVLGFINTRIILTVFFYVVILPVALVMKIMKIDPVSRKLDRAVKSYRVARAESTVTDFTRPF